MLAVLLLLGLFFLLPLAGEFYIEMRWFRSLGLGEVFSTTVRAQMMLGGVVGLVFFGALYLNGLLAVRATRGEPLRFVGERVDPKVLHRLGERVPLWFAVIFGVLAGISGMAGWDTWLLYANASEFGVTDPIFGHDVAFYVFELPAFEAARGALLWLLGLALVSAVVVHALRSSIHLVEGRIRLGAPARRHLGVLAAVVLAVMAFDAWVETRELLFSNAGPVAGASYADVNARLPMLRAEIAVAALAAVLMGVAAFRNGVLLPALALGLFAAVHVLGVRVYPELVHRFSVLPNEAQKEARFIEYNIAATRAAYGIDRVIERDLSAESELTLADIEDNHATIDNIRLWDHRPLLDTFAQIQEIRTYYEFANVDNDRYVIDGELRQTMLSPRELAASSLPHLTWINERFTFTHGYGVTLGPVNRATEEGLPELFIQDIPPVSTAESLRVTRPGIYFGELSNDHVFVHTDADEFDHPSGESSVYEAYQGRAGVRLDSLFTRLMLAAAQGNFKVLLSDDIGDRSRVLLHRDIAGRVREIAPFLAYDSDPYMIVRDDGTLAWIQDAYTRTGRYPYAEPTHDGLNYLRNSVKVVIDAYDGDATFYVNDPSDPILKTWRRIYPSLFHDLEEMPEDLRRHLRYPEDLFNLQTQMFTVYHMGEPEDVYNREDQWEVPSLTREGAERRMEPYYTIMKLPEEDREEFILMIPYTPKSKQNLAAWMVARSDGENRGELVVYRFPKDRLIFGPQQIMNRIQQDAEISRQVSLWDQRGSQAIFGTLLVIPVEESLIYVAPLYLRSEGGRIPELKRVIAVYGTRIAMEETLDGAVTAIFGATPEEVATAQPTGDVTATPEAATASASNPRRRAHALYQEATEASRRGDWATYGERLEELGRVLAAMADEAPPTRGVERGPGEEPLPEHDQRPVPQGAAEQE